MQSPAMMNRDIFAETKKINYASTAKLWRKVAHDAFVAGDLETARMAHMWAIENEMLDKEQKAKSK